MEDTSLSLQRVESVGQSRKIGSGTWYPELAQESSGKGDPHVVRHASTGLRFGS